jgi:taurine dioxygenase
MSSETGLSVRSITPTIGAVVEGLDLSKPLKKAAISQLRLALLRHRVIFLENQRLAPIQQRDFAQTFGHLHVHPVYPSMADAHEIAVLDTHPGNPTDNDNWHTDVTFIESPPMASILLARQIPPEGGDTLWSSMRAAYLGLSERMRMVLNGLDAVHDFLRSFPPELSSSRNAGEERYNSARKNHPPVVHPVVRTHPETGENALFVNNGFTTRILGLPIDESDAILRFLHQHIQKPEYVVRWKWKVNDLAIWDNRITQHYAVNDYLPHRRIMHRATVLGDRPFYRPEATPSKNMRIAS